MIPTPMKTETRKQYVQRCKQNGVTDVQSALQSWVKEAKKTK
jgi:hypothetical protein